MSRSRLFDSVKVKRPKSNMFDLSHEKKLTCNMGELIPCYLQEIIPGDKFKVKSEMLLRFAPLISPMMHRVNAYVHYFFVPNRLVWNNWETFITGGEDGKQEPTFPTLTVHEADKAMIAQGTLADYLGVPVADDQVTIDATGITINALPFRAYQTIYNEYYRDQNLTAKVGTTKNDTVDGTEEDIITVLRNRCWEKDYFTSALPWTQRGDDVLIPGSTNVEYIDTSLFRKSSDGTVLPNTETIQSSSGNLWSGSNVPLYLDNIDSVELNATINDVRRAFRLQEWLEKNARAGSRYIEQILSHFGVISSDSRLQRPEYLGGGKTPIVVSEVLSTAETTTGIVGQMAGHGIGVGATNEFTKYFEEHGYVIGILSVMPVTAYQQGLPKLFSKFDKFDYFWPEFANIGEQEITKKEVFYDFEDDGTTNDALFGYTPRYAEYKYMPSSVHGDFKTTLMTWHLGRIFGSQPNLQTSFVECDASHRVFAVEDVEDKLWIQMYHDIKAKRLMPVYGTPQF